ncbi:MAG: hypothetical protein Q8S84_07040 [bacterium]|nr:hypothetical protein [bacterium]
MSTNSTIQAYFLQIWWSRQRRPRKSHLICVATLYTKVIFCKFFIILYN